jgi:hypothetical protein
VSGEDNGSIKIWNVGNNKNRIFGMELMSE